MKNALILVAVRAALFIADRLPARVLLGAGRALGRLCHAALPSRRRAVMDNLRRVPHVAREGVAGGRRPSAATGSLRAFTHAAENLTRCLLLRRPGVRALDHVVVPLESRAVLEHALAAGRGAVVVSAHLGPFEFIPAVLVELGFRPAVVVRESYDPRLDPLVDRHRLARGVQVIHRGAPGAAARILRAIRSGRPVGFLPDLGGRVATAPTSLLGRATRLPVGPQRIAQRARCPLLVGTLSIDETSAAAHTTFSLIIEAVDTSCSEAELTHRVAHTLTRHICRLPEHWLGLASS